MKVLRDVESDIERFRLRMLVLAAGVTVAFALLISRLVWLQVVQHQHLFDQGESNRLAYIPSVPSRGLIYDRNGVVLTENLSTYTLEIIDDKVESFDKTVEALRTVVAIEPKDIKRYKRLREDSKKFEPIPIRRNLSDKEVASFAARAYKFPGVELRARLIRNYPYGDVASHLIGYIGRINQNEKEQIEQGEHAENYRGSDYIGKVGLERFYEKELHGETGLEQIETTASGIAVRRLKSKPAIPGKSLIMSVDIKLQKMIEDLFGTRRGALVALDPRNGEVLALVSKQTFDPNLFLDGIDVETWRSLNESLNKPLFNRALRGVYPPGSTYKPFMAMAALQTGARSPDKIIYDNGVFQLGKHNFRGHAVGPVNMISSIVHSSNVYYYSLASEMGVENIYKFMKPFGFGQLSEIDISGETRGTLPNQEWKRQTFKRPELQQWKPGETISLGIGQGYNGFTPVQMATATAALSNGGHKFNPRIVIAEQDGDSHQRSDIPTKAPAELGFEAKNVDLVRRAMAGVVKSGTSQAAFRGTTYTSAGKTGTAQAVTIGQKEKYNASKLAEHQRDHSLYIAFAPVDNPQIALAVIVENAGFGAISAAPIARRVFDYWLLGHYPSEADIAAVRRGGGEQPVGSKRLVSDMQLKPVPMPVSEEEAIAKDAAQ